MGDGAPRLIIVGGQVGPATGVLADALVTEPGTEVLVWDEGDVEERWTGRAGTFVVRDRRVRRWPSDRGAPGLGARVGDAELRWFLRRRATSDVLLLGAVALGAAPWLRRHRGRRAWFPTTDDLAAPAIVTGIPPVDSGGPHVVVSTEVEVRRCAPLRDEPRHRWEPGFRPAPPRPPARPEVLAWGPPDRLHGIDLVGRALATRQDQLRELGVHVRWIAPVGASIPDEEAADLRQEGVLDLIEVVEARDEEAGFRAALAAGGVAVAVCNRPGASQPSDEAQVWAHRDGATTIAFGARPAPDLAIDGSWRFLPFGDVAAAGDALVEAAVTQPASRLPGPVGVAKLLERLVGGPR
ncbi:MAG: hypothetical protein KDB04_09275 [Acidimicrobiales bacterium]|nr:hypothetical protein [Acidimicrobiales bacterium]HRW36495.1 hypothetical protein [Aquihabitans sp.]